MLRKVVKDIKLVSPELRKHYEKDGDLWKLKVEEQEDDREEPENDDEEDAAEGEGAEDEEGDKSKENVKALKAKVNQFRDNNIKLKKRLEKAEADRGKLGDIDEDEIEQLKEAKKRLEEIEDEKMVKAGQVDKLVEKRAAAIKDNYEKQLKKLQTQLQERDGRLTGLATKYKDLKLETAAIQSLASAGSLKQGAMGDAISRFKNTFKLGDDDELVTEEVDGEGQEFTPNSYAKHLTKEAPHLFEPGAGGGAAGGSKGGKSEKGVKTLSQKGSQPLEVDGATLDDIIAGKTVVEAPVTTIS